MRLFVGVWPDTSTLQALSGLRPPEGIPGLRWVPAADWHVTLSFLGSVPDDEVADVTEVLAAVAASSAPVIARVGPATQLLGRAILCVPVIGLEELAETVLGVTAPFSRSPDRDRPFFGHLTVARASRRRVIPPTAVGRAVSACWTVDAFRLVRSVTGPGGSVYETQALLTLGGPGASQDEHVFGYTVPSEHRLPDTPPP